MNNKLFSLTFYESYPNSVTIKKSFSLRCN